MKTVNIKGNQGDSTICVGESLDRLGRYASVENLVILTDKRVGELYGHRFPPSPIVMIEQGEGVKNLETVEEIYRQLLDAGADRSTCLVGIGGGIVCDIAGFVASTYMRGLRCGYVATTLLAQVDASVGGKTGVNYHGYKNIIGAFNQPAFVLCDTELLRSLPDREISSGFAEIIKHAAIADADMFAYLEAHAAEALQLDPGIIEKLVYESILIKAAVVNQDEREAGERRKLNFGHTFGHAIEKVSDLAHGQAVSVGMVIAAEISRLEGLIEQSDVDRLTTLLKKMALPLQARVDADNVWEALLKDKKREGERLYFILLEQIGKAMIKSFSIQDLRVGIEYIERANEN